MAESDQFGHVYTDSGARMYGSLGISGTTYEIGFTAVRRLLGRMKNSVVLDFGAGVGRSSLFLLDAGAARVYAVDHSESMVREGISRGLRGIDFLLSSDRIPLPDGSVDAAISANVFIEIRTRAQMLDACREVGRVTRVGCPFIIMTTNPAAFGHKYRSFEYSRPVLPQAGALALCRVPTAEGVLEISDTYWPEAVYQEVLAEAGFEDIAMENPLGDASIFGSVTDESVVPPFLVVRAIKG